MKIKVDEDLPQAVAVLLRRRGHDCQTVLDERLGGTKDPALWLVVQSEDRFLVTADKGFADVRQYPPGTHHGVLLLRPDEDGIRPILDLLEEVLIRTDLSELLGSIAVATPRSLRIRRASP